MRKTMYLIVLAFLLLIQPLQASAGSKSIFVKTYPIDQDLYENILAYKKQYDLSPYDTGTPFQIMDSEKHQHIIIPFLKDGVVAQTRTVSKYWDEEKEEYYFSGHSSQLFCKELNTLESPLLFCKAGVNTYVVENGEIIEAAMYHYPHEPGYQETIESLAQSATMMVDITKTYEDEYDYAEMIPTFWAMEYAGEILEERAIKRGHDYYIPASILSKYVENLKIQWLPETKTLILDATSASRKNEAITQLIFHVGKTSFVQNADGTQTPFDNMATFLLDGKAYVPLPAAQLLLQVTATENALILTN